jgi:hypothetical protein
VALGPGRAWWRVLLAAWPLAALVAIGIAHGWGRTALLPAFLTVVILWPATLVVGRLAGARAGAVAGVLCAGLLWLQALLPAPSPALQRSLLLRRFDDPRQSVRHVLRPPVGSAAWRDLWSRTPPPDAFLYVMVMTGPGSVDPGLRVQLGGQPLGDLTAETWAGRGKPGTETGSSGWYRLPVSRAALEQGGLLEVSIAPADPETFVPGSVGLFGGYSLRPTVPPAPSAFFDGERWSTAPSTLLPDWPSEIKGAVRFYVELRVLQSRSLPGNHRVLAIYY